MEDPKDIRIFQFLKVKLCGILGWIGCPSDIDR